MNSIRRARARRLVKLLLPPIFTELVSLLANERRFVWQGIYPDRRSIATNDRYDDDVEVKKHSRWTQAALDALRRGQKPALWHESLAVLSATIGARAGKVGVLDFGGGVGSGYVHLLAALSDDIAIDYHVVDLDAMCAEGRRVFSNDKRITFHESLAQFNGQPDIVYVNSVLQYIDDYGGLLRQLAALNAAFVLLERLAVGNFPTFASKQHNLDGKVLAYWFLNRDEIVGELEAWGYTFLCEGWDEQEFDQSNFPETHRIGRMGNLLFCHAITPATSNS